MDGGSSMMGLQLTPGGAPAGSRPSVADAEQRPIHNLFRAELLFSFGADLAAAMRDSIVRPAARRLVTRIHVSPMSLTWLQMHETEYDKHRVEL
jgi:hypothetical protein